MALHIQLLYGLTFVSLALAGNSPNSNNSQLKDRVLTDNSNYSVLKRNHQKHQKFPQLVRTPNDTTIMNGESIKLYCTGKQIQWSKYNPRDQSWTQIFSRQPGVIAVNPNPNKYVITGRYDLLIKDADMTKDATTYRCRDGDMAPSLANVLIFGNRVLDSLISQPHFVGDKVRLMYVGYYGIPCPPNRAGQSNQLPMPDIKEVGADQQPQMKIDFYRPIQNIAKLLEVVPDQTCVFAKRITGEITLTQADNGQRMSFIMSSLNRAMTVNVDLIVKPRPAENNLRRVVIKAKQDEKQFVL